MVGGFFVSGQTNKNFKLRKLSTNVVANQHPPCIFIPVIMNRLLDDLNEAQRAAVTTTDGPLLIIAGAGSGKTRVLTRRLAHILHERLAEPYQILAVTFTNKAAGEMQERVSSLLGGTLERLSVSTFHSFCARLLRREAGELGYDKSFTIFDDIDSVSLVKSCIAELGVNVNQFAPKAQRRKISNAKNQMISADTFASGASGYFEETTAKIYLRYEQRLRECNGMDFDDLLYNTVLLLKDNKVVGERYRNRFRYVMVDEYQDTNHVQYLMLKHIVGAHHNICVVGDEDQSIYGWRGADIRNILDFEKDYPGAKVVKLEQNYRSTQTILGAASAVIAHNEARKGKTLHSSGQVGDPVKLLYVDNAETEAANIVDYIDKGRLETPLNEMAVLYRTNAQSRAFEEQLRRRNLPYQIVGGIAFYQRKEIKDLLAYLKLIANPLDDISFQRIINYPKRSLGTKSVGVIVELARRESRSCYQVVANSESYPELTALSGRLMPFVDIIERFRKKHQDMPIDVLTQELVDELKLINHLIDEDKTVGRTKVENIEAFIEGAAAFARTNGPTTLVDYLESISLYTDLDAYKATEDKVTLLTLHAAKGLEYDSVFIVGLEEGLFPLQRAIDDPMELEEERRLFYVGATRARKRLYLSTASSRFRFGEVMSIPSRFIKEIPEELVDAVNLRSRPTRTPRPTPARGLFDTSSSEAATPEGVHYEWDNDHSGLRPGRIVQHPTFGRGKIMGADGFGESLRLEIMFTGIGIKKIMVKYARLKVVG